MVAPELPTPPGGTVGPSLAAAFSFDEASALGHDSVEGTPGSPDQKMHGPGQIPGTYLSDAVSLRENVMQILTEVEFGEKKHEAKPKWVTEIGFPTLNDPVHEFYGPNESAIPPVSEASQKFLLSKKKMGTSPRTPAPVRSEAPRLRRIQTTCGTQMKAHFNDSTTLAPGDRRSSDLLLAAAEKEPSLRRCNCRVEPSLLKVGARNSAGNGSNLFSMTLFGGRCSFFVFALTILCACIMALAAKRADAAGGTKVPYRAPNIPTTKFACLSKDTHRYVGKLEPSGRCEIGGLVESSLDFLHRPPKRLGKGGVFARLPVRGRTLNGTAWTQWGGPRSFGEARNLRDGHDLHLSAYGRFRCADGSTWYSKVSVFDVETAVALFLRLPVCGQSIPQGDLGTR